MKCNRREFLKSLLAAGVYINIPKPARVLIEQEVKNEIYDEIADNKITEKSDTVILQIGDETLELQYTELRVRHDSMNIDGFTGLVVFPPPSKPEYCLYAETRNGFKLNNVIAAQKRCGQQDITVRVNSIVVLQATGEVCLRWYSEVNCFEMSLHNPQIGWDKINET